MAELTGQVTFTPEEIATFPQGPLGPAGPKGDKGDQGDPGPKGDPGSGGSGSGYLPRHLVRFVDYQGGLDANSGLEPGLAKKTIQAAYDDLKATAIASYPDGGGGEGVGTINLLPGDHDVGAGVVLEALYPVEVVGTRAGWGAHSAKSSASKIYSSSASVTALVKVGSSSLGMSSRLLNVLFVGDPLGANPALTSCIKTENVNYLHVEGCAFTTPTGTGPQIQTAAIDCNVSSLDHSWMRILNNRSSRFCFLRLAGGPYNRCVIDSNVIFYDGPLAAMQINGRLFGSTISNNNLEGGCSGVVLGPTSDADKNVFINNSGESASSLPFYDFVGSVQHCIIVGGNCMCPGANGTWVKFAAAAHSNIVIGTVDPVGVTGWKQKAVDASTLGNRYLNPNGMALLYKTGSNPSITDADFPFGANKACQDGLQAVTYATSGAVAKLWTRANGTWFSVVLS